ncbi:MAG: DnaJ domain-containing protein [Pseudomonadota bacterium]
MKLESKYFDSIRVGGKRKRSTAKNSKAVPESHEHAPDCQWKGCDKPGVHRAPAGRGRDGEFFFFCVDHVRQYNQSYNYFDGMSDDEVADFQQDAMTGHRPTWKMGGNSGAAGAAATNTNQTSAPSGHDPHGFFAWRAKQARQKASERRRKLKPLEKKSLDALMLGENATGDEIRAQYKALVKEHHPDANGGDRRSEEKLREIIQAYNFLKQAGFV